MRVSLYPDGRWAYRCDFCGLVQPWTPESVWFGSLLEDNPKTYCSQAHGDAHAASGRRGAPPKNAKRIEAIK